MTHRLLPTVAGADDARADDATELKEELDEDRVPYVVFISCCSSSGAQSGRSGIYSIRGGLLLFWFHTRTLIVSR